MNWIDIIIAIPLLWGLYKGFTRGIIIEAATLIAFGLAVWSGIKFHYSFSEWMRNSLGWDSAYLPLISLVILFIGILLIVFSIAKLIQYFVKAASLGFVNRIAGAIFGMFKFGFLLSMIIFFLEAINKSIEFIPNETKTNSLLYTYVQKIAPSVIPGLNESTLHDMMPTKDSVNLEMEK